MRVAILAGALLLAGCTTTATTVCENRDKVRAAAEAAITAAQATIEALNYCPAEL